MAGLFNLTDDAVFEVDESSSPLHVVVRQVPDEYGLDTVALAGRWS